MQLKANSTFPRLIRPFLNLASLVFKFVSFVNIKIKALRQKEFSHLFIISVDSLSFGGTGKTPLVMAIGRALEKKRSPLRHHQPRLSLALRKKGGARPGWAQLPGSGR
jgi:tetraacyldisaccharide-1-P 4'-kinase